MNAAGQLHNAHGPALLFPKGGKAYYINGVLSRSNGPAVEFSNGNIEYYVDGKLHRTDGPAIVNTDGRKRYFEHGEFIKESGFVAPVAKQYPKIDTHRMLAPADSEDGPYNQVTVEFIGLCDIVTYNDVRFARIVVAYDIESWDGCESVDGDPGNSFHQHIIRYLAGLGLDVNGVELASESWQGEDAAYYNAPMQFVDSWDDVIGKVDRAAIMDDPTDMIEYCAVHNIPYALK